MKTLKQVIMALLILTLNILLQTFAQESPTPSVTPTAVEILRAEEEDAELLQSALELRKTKPDLFAGAQGVLVTEIVPNSQAEKHGLLRGDILIAYNNYPVNFASQLVALVQETKPAQNIEVSFIRSSYVRKVMLKGGKIGIELRDITTELPFEQFLIQFFSAMNAKDIEKMGQILKENPDTTAFLLRKLKSTDETSEESYQTRGMAELITRLLDDDSTLAQLQEEAIAYFQVGDYSMALTKFQEGLDLSQKSGNTRYMAHFLSGCGVVYRSLGQYKQAFENFQQSLQLSKEIHDRLVEAESLANIAMLSDDLGYYQLALENYQQALTIQREIRSRTGEGRSLTNIGAVYKNLGQSQRALEYYQQALIIQRELQDKSAEGATLHNIGAVYQSQRQYQQALDIYQQALEIHRELHERDEEASDLTNIGIIYQDLNDPPKSLETFFEALKINREIHDRLSEGHTLNNIGWTYRKSKEDSKSRDSFQKGINILQEYPTDSLWRPRFGLALIEASQNNLEVALQNFLTALSDIENLRSAITEKEFKLSFIEDKIQVYDLCISLLQRLHEQQPDQNYARQAFEIFERKQARIFLEDIGKSHARLFSGIPEEILLYSEELLRKYALTRQKLSEMHRICEAEGCFSEDINTRQIRQLEQELALIQQEQQSLENDISTHYHDYYALKYPQPSTSILIQAQSLQADELLLVYNITEEQNVLWIISKQDFRFIPLKINEIDLQEKIEAFRAIPNAIVNAIHSGNKMAALRLADDTLNKLAQQSYALYQQLLPEEARKLVANAKILYIVPTGPLYGLPFEALVTEVPMAGKMSHYLIQDHPISYLSSASLLKILRDAQARRKQTQRYPLLAFANPVYDPLSPTPLPEDEGQIIASISGSVGEDNFALQALRRQAYLALMGGSNFSALPETETQVKAIADLLEAPQTSDALQLGEQASRSNVLRLNTEERLDDYQYVMFAAHAVLPGEVDYVNQPAIVLSHPDTEDGFLTMADAFSLQLNADLVVLSACNTGRGEEIRGEGIMGLTRAFMYAGTPAVSVTLWPVEANAANALYTNFFRHLKEHQPLATALRQAKLDLLKQAGEDEELAHFSHPFFWAPFVVFGDGGMPMRSGGIQ